MFWSVVLIVGVGCGWLGVRGEGAWSVSEAVRVGVGVVREVLGGRGRGGAGSGEQVGVKGSGGGEEVVRVVLRMMGFNSKKVQELAFEGLISLVHLMREVLIPDGRRKKRKDRREVSLLGFIVNQPQVRDVLVLMQEPRLMEDVMEVAEEKLKELPKESTECVRLLLCKTTPFVRGMQRSLRFFMRRENVRLPGEEEDEEVGGAWEEAGLEERMYFFVPGLSEVVENGDRCEDLFPNCVY